MWTKFPFLLHLSQAQRVAFLFGGGGGGKGKYNCKCMYICRKATFYIK
jgi:hypothetical protein